MMIITNTRIQQHRDRKHISDNLREVYGQGYKLKHAVLLCHSC